ncbi:activating transcription factor, other eukaryote [Exophiala aquamarina CBS 119918]|uniref:Activating transcription factor, other eukaryote n=1 Tax=Exophiala aquamarina CBS 119918 TaxID=1182545 RepID=A0A072PS86_9EURO|nr:activating transcription factor, other eukaryote [Exophiala aquamarina CBS 119918]KEF62964.1 activating transcription factor, other eukaryote [Exophiala aquamarina CBS 119918]
MASAAVATQPSQQHIGAGPTSRTSSPMDSKKATLKPKESQTPSLVEDLKPVIQASEPLAPPPRPAPANPTETPDYFSALHNNDSGIGQEFNPFEQSFGAPSTETPGKNLLPPVAALTSPAIPGTSSTGGYNWQSSLRSGPLSPAMLAGPQQGDYFDSIGRGFPTPNESSLRTGLTPGGGGSMFPAPSPNSQALFNSLASGGATPGTLDFHRTAMNAAARNKNNQFATTSNPQEPQPQTNTNMDAQHDATDAANGLFMLAKGGQGNNQFAVANSAQPARSTQDQKASNGNVSGGDADSNGSPGDNSRSNTRGGRGKKPTKAEPASKNSRKSDATPKGSNKRSKGNSGAANVDPALDPHEEDEDDNSDMDEDMETTHPNGKKMTDEEKRRNFLERNRVAALKCRQRKKQWLANLQAKVEMYSAENDSLNTQVAQLHEEIRNLRTLLVSHKDCAVGHAQGIGNFLNGMQDPNGFPNQHVNPYGMPMPSGPQMQAGMQRT